MHAICTINGRENIFCMLVSTERVNRTAIAYTLDPICAAGCRMSEVVLQVLPQWHLSSIRANSAYEMLAQATLKPTEATSEPRNTYVV